MVSERVAKTAEMANSASSELNEGMKNMHQEEPTISASLKFVVSNIKNIVSTELNQDNYAVWRSQILKLFRANGFDKFLESFSPSLPPSLPHSTGSSQTTQAGAQWNLTDQNLSASLCSTISASILPYVINLSSTAAIWSTLENRFQATNRSKVIQLKNSLHHISLKNLTMNQYLSEIKVLVDQIASAGSSVDNEDIILYILNGLPPQYQAFKTAIRTMLTPITLDQLYPLLLSEEINIASDASRNPSMGDSNLALFSSRGRGRRNRGRSSQPSGSTSRQSGPPVTCQICLKKGHSASDCWHRLNAQYVPSASAQQSKAMIAASDNSHDNWFLDSGATSHLTNSLENMTLSTPYQGSDNVTIGDGRSLSIANSGVGILPTPTRKLKLSQIFHSPQLRFNLLSISKLTRDNDISITFNPAGFVFKDLKTQQILLQGPCNNGLYPIQTAALSIPTQALAATSTDANLWHQRLGHPNDRVLQKLSNSIIHCRFNKFHISCSSCKESKSHKLVFDKSVSRRNSILDLIHSDIWGPAPVVSHHGFRYYVLFVDDFSRFSWIFSIRCKTEVFNVFTAFKNQIEKYTSRSIKMIRTDGGTEYVNHTFTQYMRTHGITHQISCPYTPEQNGVAERKHRHILETSRTLLNTASIPYNYWPEAILTSVYLINRMPSPNTTNLSPFELFHKTQPRYDHLRTFGCECFYLLPPHSHHKLQPKSKSCVFLGYSDTYKGYKCLDLTTNKIHISRHTDFNEHVFPFKNSPQSPNIQPTSSIPFLLQPISAQDNSHTILGNNSATTYAQPTISSQVPQPTQSDISSNSNQAEAVHPNSSSTYHHMLTRAKTGSLKPRIRLNLLHSTSQNTIPITPTSYTEAAKQSEWRTAMALEFFALQKQGTWSLVEPPHDATILGCKWTYRIKYHADGTIAKHKARLVAQGNHQEYGLDYTETFSPVAKLPTIRVLLTVALNNEWPVHQLDVANAFLHGNIEETIYMAQPRGFEDPSHPQHVCRLHKAIYGLKQAPRQWYNTFTSYLTSIGFFHNTADPSMLCFKTNCTQVFLLIYVDDILITGNNQTEISMIIEKLHKQFSMKDLGQANDFLGVKIDTLNNSYFLSQKSYAWSLLQLAQMTACNPLANPSCTKLPTVFQDDPLLSDPTLYRRLTGALQYLTITRPDIAYSVNQLSQHMHNPLSQHVYLLKRLLRYLKGTLDYGIPISKSNLVLSSFSDADWAGDPISRRSTSGYCSFLGNTIISWTVKKQHTVARSSTESEYRALAALTADIIWLRRLLADFGINQDEPTDMYCDNMSAIALANNPVFHARTKHIEIDQKFIRDHIHNKSIRLLPINTIDQTADIFTKSLSTPRFVTLRDKLTVTIHPSVCRGVLDQTHKEPHKQT
ncbi:Retrovirus-related Pol polyprotein from transposon TNT 1-94 [Dendrobium catenatum]|uniref:Retrovirus-related Pol polyprotein from transposon TNT 1-94 n=1 Tax=Dendrobium catenatum TaxID=906689 RepID=A0A2I0VQ35_9ASPA|nr:Retrovirus-related Pol polyprotein from transposon TNT 1-94 [Dendrobium catenatum]